MLDASTAAVVKIDMFHGHHRILGSDFLDMVEPNIAIIDEGI